jgi:hypothetical protein
VIIALSARRRARVLLVHLVLPRDAQEATVASQTELIAFTTRLTGEAFDLSSEAAIARAYQV